jgi:formylmethanofuran dehydrogenase subunit E
VFLDPGKLEDWPEIKSWFYKLKPKKEQDGALLRDQIIEAGAEILTVERVQVDIASLGKKGKGAIATCPSCGEAYPAKDGATGLACQGNSPYRKDAQAGRPDLKVVPHATNKKE